jgi:signal transduction histidine kinase
LVIWTAAASPAWSATRHVFLLYDERLDLPGLAALDGDIVHTLTANSADPIEVYREAMDLSRFPSDKYRLLLRDFLREKYANKKIDVAIAILGPSLDFLLDYGAEIFPGTPIVFCGVDRKELGERSLPPHVHGVLVKRQFAPTLGIALSIHPDTNRVVVVSGTSEFDTRLLDQAKSEFRPYEARMSFTYLTGLPLQQILAELANLPPHTLVLYTTFFQDGTGATFIPHNVVQHVAEAARVPVYGFLDQYLGRGIVGGSLYSFAVHGAETANLALRILANSAGSEPSLLEAPADKVMFDWRQMQRWKISEARLPAGSEIRFRDQTIWDRYREQIIAICVALAFQAGLILWLLYEHRRRNLAEIQSRESLAELTYMNRRATAGELSASIAHEVSQPLTAISVTVAAALAWLRRKPPELGQVHASLEEIAEASNRAGDIVKSIRAIFKKETQPGRVDVNQIITTVLDLARIEIHKHNIELRTELAPLPTITGDGVQLQQVILNLIMNAIEAMQQTRQQVLSITSELSNADAVRLSVEDTGSGIDPANMERIFSPMFTTKSAGMGMGLSICHSIIESHHGRIWVEPRPAGGSIFWIELPVGGTP